MKHINALKKYGPTVKRYAIGVAGFTLIPATSALAAIPSTVNASFTEMSTDFTTLWGYAFGVLVVISGSMLVWRYVRKLSGKL